jgi:large subunit ribosomal protein L15e
MEEMYKKKQSDVLRFLLRMRNWEWRHLPSIHRAPRPTRPDKARRLGYKAKQGFDIYRGRVRRRNRKKPVPTRLTNGKPKNQGVTHLKPKRQHRNLAEERAGRKLGGLRLLNSYWVNQDSTYKYYECIMIDPAHNCIRGDPRINWICKASMKHRELRGVTSAGRHSRGMLHKGIGTHKIRPSIASVWKKNNTTKFRRYRPAKTN